MRSSRVRAGLFRWAADWWRRRSMTPEQATKHYESEIAKAHSALLSVKQSPTVLVEVHDKLQQPIAELARLEFPELRKLAHHAFYGIGAWRMHSDVVTAVTRSACVWSAAFALTSRRLCGACRTQERRKTHSARRNCGCALP
jgi:hypothetical protein